MPLLGLQKHQVLVLGDQVCAVCPQTMWNTDEIHLSCTTACGLEGGAEPAAHACRKVAIPRASLLLAPVRGSPRAVVAS